jgi:glutathione-regulated potassium-efflux system ancillary protein KefF
MPDILVLAAHPQIEHSHVNRALMHAAAEPGGGRIEVRDLYALYPDYLIDVEAEQAILAQARMVVWLHPIHWYSMPPLMKLWLDEVLSFGWAYGPGGHALQGKDLWLVASTGGPPYEQTAALTGMRWLPPLVLHGAHRADEATLAAHLALFVERLAAYPDWPELAGLEENEECEVPANARPAAD